MRFPPERAPTQHQDAQRRLEEKGGTSHSAHLVILARAQKRPSRKPGFIEGPFLTIASAPYEPRLRETNPMKRPALGRVLRGLLFLAALAFVLKTAYGLSQAWGSHAIQVDGTWLGVALALNSAALYAQGLAFLAILSSWLGRPLDRKPALSVFFASQLARYTPGKVGLPGVRLAHVTALGGSKQQVLVGTIVEVLVWLSVGGLTGVLFFAAFPFVWIAPGTTPQFVLVGLSILLSVLGFKLAALNWALVRRFVSRLIPSFVPRLDGPKDTSPLAPPSSVGWFLAHWVLTIATGGALCLAIHGPVAVAIPAGTTLVLAIVLGFLSLFAPGGVGIREAVLATCAAPLVGAKEATVLGILARIVSLVAEILLWAGSRILARRAAGS